VVDALGPGSTGWSVGDRAGVAWLASTCGACRFCLEERENLCERSRFTGWDTNGGFAQYVVARAGFALHLPDGFDDLSAAPLLCGGVIGYRSLKVSGIAPGQRLGLYGFGASALCAIQVARHWDCEVYVSTRSAAEQQRALELGAAWAGSYEELPPASLHAAITFAPAGDVVIRALQALAPGGTVAINAIHLDRIPEFDYSLLWKERVLRSVANFTRQDASELLRMAADIPIRTAIERFPLDEANTALAALSRGAVKGAAVIVVD
jgi:propanol-preferring alcohol dehydrogenase